ncbi:hypothetical protein HN873_043754, partial [Arachis hypogaea]
IISSSLSVFFVKPILIQSLLNHISLLTLSGIRAKIESDRKRKKSPVVPAEQKEKHKPYLNKRKKMSYCGNSDGGDGAEVRASHILVKLQVSQVEDMGTTAAGYNRVVEENGKLFIMVQDLKDEIFKDTDLLIRSLMDGYNVCIFTYGETRFGKTYTIDMGINYVPINYLFQMCNDRKDIMTYDIYVQMVGIYNEQVRDLLAEDKTDNKLEIRSYNDDGLSLSDATLSPVTSRSDVLTLMKLGEVKCAVSSTALNNRSSCSHG